MSTGCREKKKAERGRRGSRLLAALIRTTPFQRVVVAALALIVPLEVARSGRAVKEAADVRAAVIKGMDMVADPRTRVPGMLLLSSVGRDDLAMSVASYYWDDGNATNAAIAILRHKPWLAKEYLGPLMRNSVDYLERARAQSHWEVNAIYAEFPDLFSLETVRKAKEVLGRLDPKVLGEVLKLSLRDPRSAADRNARALLAQVASFVPDLKSIRPEFIFDRTVILLGVLEGKQEDYYSRRTKEMLKQAKAKLDDLRREYDEEGTAEIYVKLLEAYRSFAAEIDRTKLEWVRFEKDTERFTAAVKSIIENYEAGRPTDQALLNEVSRAAVGLSEAAAPYNETRKISVITANVIGLEKILRVDEIRAILMDPRSSK